MSVTKLFEHRINIRDNPDAYEFEFKKENIKRLCKGLACRLRCAGYKKLTLRNGYHILQKIIQCIFDSQDRLPIFHIQVEENGLPLCWNQPRDWENHYIKYEWGHLISINQNDKADKLDNLGLYSARCNQHIQSSMNIEELKIYGGKLSDRISKVLDNRKKMFQSDDWKKIENELDSFRI
ncbi:MAG: hypothetical protein H7833_04140 [Magnetococcus sp. DMHC-1]